MAELLSKRETQRVFTLLPLTTVYSLNTTEHCDLREGACPQENPHCSKILKYSVFSEANRATPSITCLFDNVFVKDTFEERKKISNVMLASAVPQLTDGGGIVCIWGHHDLVNKLNSS